MGTVASFSIQHGVFVFNLVVFRSVTDVFYKLAEMSMCARVHVHVCVCVCVCVRACVCVWMGGCVGACLVASQTYLLFAVAIRETDMFR